MPCYKRCKEIEWVNNYEKVIESDDADSGWVDTHHYSSITENVQQMTLSEDEQAGFGMKSSNKSLQKQQYATNTEADDDEDEDDDEAGDMDMFVATGRLDDDDKVFLWQNFLNLN